MKTYLIIDDEPIAHDIIKGYCDLLPELTLKKQCFDAIEALSYLNDNEVHLIFLDLNMPKLKGFAFLKTLSNPPKVIITTAYKEFALEGFELNVVDYLLKPFSFERFLKAINKVFNSKDQENNLNEQQSKQPDTIFLRSNKKYLQVVVKEILFLESAGNYVKVVTKDKTITVRDKVSDLLEKFPEGHFLKVHKSYAVAKVHIKSIEGNRLLIAEHVIPIGKIYRSGVDALLK